MTKVEQNRFERDTAVRHLGGGRYRGTIDPGWAVINGAPNGGYVLALAARAMRDGLPHPDPVSVTAHFLAPPDPGPVDVEVEHVRTGRRHSTVAARVLQDGRERTRLLGTFADLGAADGPTRIDRTRFELPPLEDCIEVTAQSRTPSEDGAYAPPPILTRFDHRMPADMMGWTQGRPLGRGEMGGYLQWADGAPMDTLGLLVVADCYPPPVFNMGDTRVGWVPTIELTVQIRGRPSDGYLATRFTTQTITAGYLEEDGEVWDARGELVVLSRQLALAAR